MPLPSITSGPVTFSERPCAGHVHVYRDQIYTLMESQEADRILFWKSYCCDCGMAFTVTSSFKGGNGFSRRCADHRQLGKKVVQRNVHPFALGYHGVTVVKPEAVRGEVGRWSADMNSVPYLGEVTKTGKIVDEGFRNRIISDYEKMGVDFYYREKPIENSSIEDML